ncbi:MAG: hypothetical protein N2260_05475 [Syntrophobacterales bacterium]|nr:hypothetical protein [Syntrophobacterales bacterium]
MFSPRTLIPLTTVFFLLASSTAFPHKIQIFAYVNGGKIFVESYFADGSPVRGGAVEAYSKDGSKVMEGKTDDKGMFSFPIPKDPLGLKIVVDAGMGHRAEYTLKKEDLGR